MYRKTYRGNKSLNRNLIPYLSCNYLPLTLIGVSLRTILPSNDYSKLVRKTKNRVRNNCEFCGRYVERSLDDYIHIQELLKFDFNSLVVRYNGLVGLCRDCYYMFNFYSLKKDLENLVINRKYFSRIVSSRLRLLRSHGFEPTILPKRKVWVYEYGGFRYINDFIPEILERAISSGVRVLPMRKGYYPIGIEYYYHN